MRRERERSRGVETSCYAPRYAADVCDGRTPECDAARGREMAMAMAVEEGMTMTRWRSMARAGRSTQCGVDSKGAPARSHTTQSSALSCATMPPSSAEPRFITHSLPRLLLPRLSSHLLPAASIRNHHARVALTCAEVLDDAAVWLRLPLSCSACGRDAVGAVRRPSLQREDNAGDAARLAHPPAPLPTTRTHPLTGAEAAQRAFTFTVLPRRLPA